MTKARRWGKRSPLQQSCWCAACGAAPAVDRFGGRYLCAACRCPDYSLQLILRRESLLGSVQPQHQKRKEDTP
jgi:hypothetical protein